MNRFAVYRLVKVTVAETEHEEYQMVKWPLPYKEATEEAGRINALDDTAHARVIDPDDLIQKIRGPVGPLASEEERKKEVSGFNPDDIDVRATFEDPDVVRGLVTLMESIGVETSPYEGAHEGVLRAIKVALLNALTEYERDPYAVRVVFSDPVHVKTLTQFAEGEAKKIAPCIDKDTLKAAVSVLESAFTLHEQRHKFDEGIYVRGRLYERAELTEAFAKYLAAGRELTPAEFKFLRGLDPRFRKGL